MRLIYDLFPERYDSHLIINLFETFPEGFLVAEENNRVVGFILGVKPSGDAARILLLGVSEGERKKGVGSCLLNRFINTMVLKGSKRIELEVRVSNKEAVCFYKKHGFHTVRTLPNFYRAGEDAYLMMRWL
ncbi:MAG TPA: GNAT family N-acetyltransferase [Thermoplasmata archaeon]|nr:GNAT family N-acetyltransferase [Thermoplasmata archaeon]